MENAESSFEVKLNELEQRWMLMQKELRFDQYASHDAIEKEIKVMMEMSQSEERELMKQIEQCSSLWIAKLADIQRESLSQMRAVLSKQIDHVLQHQDHLEESVEAASVYAEYAIDAVMQSINHAVIAILSAMELQMTYEEREMKNE